MRGLVDRLEELVVELALEEARQLVRHDGAGELHRDEEDDREAEQDDADERQGEAEDGHGLEHGSSKSWVMRVFTQVS